MWRAATGVPDADRRPTGPRQLQKAAALWQRHLNQHANTALTPAWQQWGTLLHELAPHIRGDEFAPQLAVRLAALTRAGINASHLLTQVCAAGVLPDDHPAAAIWWRITGHLTPAGSADLDGQQQLAGSWTDRLPELVGPERAARLQGSRWWPVLVTAVDTALHHGWPLHQLLTPAADGSADECQAMVWRTTLLTDPTPPDPDDPDAPDEVGATDPGEPAHPAQPAPTMAAGPRCRRPVCRGGPAGRRDDPHHPPSGWSRRMRRSGG